MDVCYVRMLRTWTIYTGLSCFFFIFTCRELASSPHLQSLDCSCSSSVDESGLKAFVHQASGRSDGCAGTSVTNGYRNNTTTTNQLKQILMIGCNINSSLPWDVIDDLEHWKDCRLQVMDLSSNDISANDKKQLLSAWQTAVSNNNNNVIGGIGMITRRKCRFTLSPQT